jgi:hypothetical protein
MNLIKRFIAVSAVAVLSHACGGDGTGPDDGGLSLAAQTNDIYFGTRNSTLEEPLQALVLDPVAKSPKSNVAVSWRVVQGSATLSSTTTLSNSEGVASVIVRLSGELGTSVVEAFVPKLVGAPARFTVRAVDAPQIATLSPTSARAGDTITVNGQNFSPTTTDNTLLFSGFRARILSATTTQLRAVVPLCIPARSVSVVAMLGSVAGNQIAMTITGGTTVSALQLARGDARTFGDPAELACFTLPGGVAGLSVLLMPQNYSEVVATFSSFELTALTGTSVAAAISDRPLATTTDAADAWEINLRRRERDLLKGPGVALRPQFSSSAANCPAPPRVGDRCEFQVINKSNTFDRVTAELKSISSRALIYQDLNTSASNGLTAEDFQQLGALFDDPIYSTDVAAFGAPSDIDSNGRILILMTPVVNALSTSQSSYIAGFFYGCDLLARASCSGSNEGEIFYALTTDPTGQFGGARSRDLVKAALPPVLAHEFQHMINFAQRNKSQDALWLAEGMAHHAEDLVADEFQKRGDEIRAAQFRTQNNTRADRYLRSPSSVSLVAESEASSLELRGAAWLFVKYLAGQYGNEILARLSRSTLSSVSNVTTQTGKSWSALMAEWGIALWADDATELAGVTLRRELTFPNMNMRQRFGSSYPLRPVRYSFVDFIERQTLPASSQAYVIVQAGNASSLPLHLSYAGSRGGPFATNASPQMTVLRIN